ncbi:hypothetical protein, partial [Clostridioides difficile]|uniref:hypothetical protein n=1 Tax=Clostridioides difficile TaxID=1496 RepID=UPI001F400F8E
TIYVLFFLRSGAYPDVNRVGRRQRKMLIRDRELVDFQNNNAIEPDDVDIIFHGCLGNPRVLDCIEQGNKMFKWDEKKKLPKEEGKYLRGIGMAIGAHGN